MLPECYLNVDPVDTEIVAADAERNCEPDVAVKMAGSLISYCW